MQPKDFLICYAAIVAVAVIWVLRRKPRRGMLLRLRARGSPKAAGGRDYSSLAAELRGSLPPENVSAPNPAERPLNVVFNYNGHSWDAYEVLGLPAGSSPERLDQAYEESLQRVDQASRPFMEAAYEAIQAQWKTPRVSNNS